MGQLRHSEGRGLDRPALDSRAPQLDLHHGGRTPRNRPVGQKADRRGGADDAYKRRKLDRAHDAAHVRVLVGVARISGDDDINSALSRGQLAQSLGALGRYDEAEEHFRTALPIIERLGEDHNQYLKSLNNYAVLLNGQGKVGEAEPIYRELLAIRLEKYGESHQEVASSMQNLAVALFKMGAYTEAEELLTRARDIYVQVLRPGHYLTALPLLTRSELQIERGDYVAAEASAVEATRVLRAALPDGHYVTAVAECRWGRALAGQGRNAEAEALLIPAVESLAEATQVPEYVAECRGALDSLRTEPD